VAILSEDGSVLGLNPAESLLAAITRIVILSINSRGQQARDQHGSKASHCERRGRRRDRMALSDDDLYFDGRLSIEFIYPSVR
jgi:hypothetical protein